MKPTILVRVTCVAETATQVAEALGDLLKSFGQKALIKVTDGSGRPGTRLIEMTTERPFSEEEADNIFTEPGYDAVLEYPGVLFAEAVSSLADRPRAMTELEARHLAGRITEEAPWLQRASVRPAHEVNDDFPPDEGAFVCWIEGYQFSSEIYNATEWGELFERLDYENRLNAFAMQTDEPDVRPFHRYVMDSPTLPNPGTYRYLDLERQAVRSFLLAATLPPWRSAVRTQAGIRTIYTLSKVRVPVSVASFSLLVGDQALVVTSTGEVGLLVREK